MDTPKTTPKDFFLYFGAMLTLYWSAGSLLALLFAIIDTVIHDNLDYYLDPYSGGIRFAIASLLVIFPTSLILFTAVKRDALKQPGKLLLPLRKWLYALTVFVTTGTLAGDIIALLQSFLGGELSTRFLLKALAVFLVAGVVLFFSFVEIRTKPEQQLVIRKSFMWETSLLVLATIIFGFMVMGSPATIRNLRFDEQRVSDLQNIQWQIVNYWQQKGKMPKALSDLEDPISGYRSPSDPTSTASYEFKSDGEHAFTLCAVFQLPLSVRRPNAAYPHLEDLAGKTWEHGAGRTCFSRTLDPELYPHTKR